MKNLLLVGFLFLLFSECSNKKIDRKEPSFKMEVLNSYIQREIAGVANVEDRLYIVLEIQHSENCKIEKIQIQNQEVALKKVGLATYEAKLNPQEFVIIKNQDQDAVLFYWVDEEEKEVRIYHIKQREPVYLP